MSKKKTKDQIIQESSNTRRDKEKPVSRKELSDLCKRYLEKKEHFKWFIEKYYGPRKYIELWELAENNQEIYLRNELEAIWFDLPDHIFNIRENPPGWESFLSLIEE